MSSSFPSSPTSPQIVTAVGYDGEPLLVEPEIRRLDGAVREVSVPAFVTPVTYGSLADLPFDNANEDPEVKALSRRTPDGSWEDVTAAEFAAQVLALAKGLIAEGLLPGDRLAIMARTTYEWTLMDFAAWAAGLVTVPIYPTSSAFQTRWILQDSGAVALAAETIAQASALGPERDRIPDLKHMWVFEKGHVERLAELGKDVPDQEVAVRRGVLGPDTLATLIYTSGTTGRPKGCALTHGNFFAEVDNAIELLYPVFRERTKEEASVLLFLPMSHVFGRMVAIACIRAGCAPRPRPEPQVGRPAGGPGGLPAHLSARHPVHAGEGLQHGPREGRDGQTGLVLRPRGERGPPLQRSGGGPAARHRQRPEPLTAHRTRLLRPARLPPYPQRHGRQGPLHDLRRLPARPPAGRLLRRGGHRDLRGIRPDRVHRRGHGHATAQTPCGHGGLALPGTRVRIAADGEVELSGEQILRGYWDPSAGGVVPAAPEGWLATGDIGSLDEEGYLTITGRKKEILITADGKSVAPAPMENWLRAHP